MEALKSFGISMCAILIVSSILSMIVPNISHKNTVKVLISAFVLSGILYSFTEFINKTDISFDSIILSEKTSISEIKIEYPKKIHDELEKCTVNALYPIISDKLNEYGIDQFGINVLLDSKNDGTIIKCVNITIDKQHINSVDVVLKEIEDELGLNIKINVLKSEGK